LREDEWGRLRRLSLVSNLNVHVVIVVVVDVVNYSRIKQKKKKKTKKVLLTSNNINDIASSPDPWKELRSEFGGAQSPAEELEYLMQTKAKTRKINADEFNTSSKDKENVILSLQSTYFEKDTQQIDTLDVSGLKLSKLVFSSGETVSRIVRVDVSSNRLKSINFFDDSTDDRCRCWVRSIDCRKNLLCELNILTGFPKLLCLDLSHNKIRTIHKDLFTHTPRLRWLRMRQCGIKTEHLGSLMSLEFSLAYVDLGENDLSNFTLIKEKLLQLKQLESIDIDRNPFLSREKMDVETLSLFLKRKKPRVKTLNGVSLGHANVIVIPMSTNKSSSSSGDDVLTLSDGASCSCLEGNPCVSPYNCKDWLHRHEIAEKVRETKGRTR